MKYLLLLVLPLLLGNEPEKPATKENVKQVAEEPPIDIETCSCKGKKLWGKVEVVTCGADFKVEIVEALPDIKVEVVSAAPRGCGQWEFVRCGADFKIEFVSCGADFKIEFVEAAPGISGRY